MKAREAMVPGPQEIVDQMLRIDSEMQERGYSYRNRQAAMEDFMATTRRLYAPPQLSEVVKELESIDGRIYEIVEHLTKERVDA